MSDLSVAIKKSNLYHDAVIGLQKVSYNIYGPAKYTPGALFKLSFKVRAAQVMLTAGKIKMGVIGDSRMAQFETLINAEPHWLCLALSGSKEDPDWMAMWDDVLLAAKIPLFPCVMHEEIGNDFLAGATVEQALKNRLIVRAHLKQYFKVVLEQELCPLSPDAARLFPGDEWKEINKRINTFNPLMKQAVGDREYVTCNEEFAPDGVGKPEFFVPDGVHWGEPAWPVLKDKWKEALILNEVA